MKVTICEQRLKTTRLMPDERLRETVIHYCGPLVAIHEVPGHCSTVTLVHSPLKDFLLNNRYPEDGPLFWIDPDHSHRVLAQVCLTYLCYDNIEPPPYEVSRDDGEQLVPRTEMERRFSTYIQRYPLLEYSSLHWWWHCRRASFSPSTYTALLRLCHSATKTVRWLQILLRYRGDRGAHGSSLSQDDLSSITSVKEILPADEGEVISNWLKFFERPANSRSILTRWKHFLASGSTNYFLPEIHVAAFFDFTELIEQYLDAGAGVNQRSHTGQTPLSLAALSDAFNSMKVLIRHGASVNVRNVYNNTPLFWAVGRRPWETPHPVPYTAGHLLLDAGADPCQDNGEIFAMVCRGSFGRDPFCLSFAATMLKRGATAVINQGHPLTQLHCAAKCGDAALVQLLLDHGASVDSSSWGNEKETPLIHACASTTPNVLEVVELLLNAGASVKARCLDGRSALHLAARHSSKLAAMLLKAGAEVNAQSVDGCTPLHDAVTEHNLDLIDLLIASSACLDVKNAAHQTPLALALENRNHRVIERLQDAGATTGDSSASAELQPIYWPQQPRDIFEVFWMLQRCGREPLPRPVVLRILDLARYWLLSRASREDPVSLVEEDCQERHPYLTSEPIRGGHTSPVREIKFVVWSHDQGFSSYPEFHGTFENSWTWFDLGIERPVGREPIILHDDKERCLTSNIHASSKFRRHQIIYRQTGSNQKGRWIENLQAGDRVSILGIQPGETTYEEHPLRFIVLACYLSKLHAASQLLTI